MLGETASIASGDDRAATHSRRRDVLEFATAYGLILLVIWTPRPWQRYLWWVAAASIAGITARSFEGRQAVGLRTGNFLRSLWVVGLALVAAAAAIIFAGRMDVVRLPEGPIYLLKNYWAYSLWAFVQQFLLQGFFLSRLLRLVSSTGLAVTSAAILFASAHLPNPILTPVTLLFAFAACWVFLRYRNLYALAMAHAILGITIAIVAPKPMIHNMRVGLGYLTYNPAHRSPHSAQPQRPDRVH
ncbi:MAG: CPBP family intramembrane glutamic endopeptidase [Terracidiphilus sp.]|jgi:hypothetical protein